MRRLWGIAAFVLVAWGCQSSPPKVGESPVSPDSNEESEYKQMLDRYSGHSEVYSNFETHSFLAATLENWSFRQARARRQAIFRSEPKETSEAQLAKEKAEFDQYIEFFLGAYLTDYHFDDFDMSHSVWRVALMTDAGEVTPLKIERLGRATYDMRGYYPYLSDFWTAYRVRFPKSLANGQPVIGPDVAKVTLKIASTLGQATMTFPAQ